MHNRALLATYIVTMLALVAVLLLYYKGVQGGRFEEDLGSQLKYAVIIDAGSTGSRVHVYRYTSSSAHSLPSVLLPDVQLKVSPGLSYYGENPKAAAASLEPLIQFALKEVPSHLCSHTPIHLLATAGLRMLDGEQSEAVLQSVRALLHNTSLLFRDAWANILPGELEGIYAWTGFNYASGALQAVSLSNLDQGGQEEPGSLFKAVSEPPSGSTWGVIELGGASLQITFMTTEMTVPGADARFLSIQGGTRSLPLYTHSFLGYGAAVAYARVATAAQMRADRRDPCLPAGFKTDSGILGSGDFEGCKKMAAALLPEVPCKHVACSIDGHYLPTLEGVFLATENFFYTAKRLGVPVGPYRAVDRITLANPSPAPGSTLLSRRKRYPSDVSSSRRSKKSSSRKGSLRKSSEESSRSQNKSRGRRKQEQDHRLEPPVSLEVTQLPDVSQGEPDENSAQGGSQGRLMRAGRKVGSKQDLLRDHGVMKGGVHDNRLFGQDPDPDARLKERRVGSSEAVRGGLERTSFGQLHRDQKSSGVMGGMPHRSLQKSHLTWDSKEESETTKRLPEVNAEHQRIMKGSQLHDDMEIHVRTSSSQDRVGHVGQHRDLQAEPPFKDANLRALALAGQRFCARSWKDIHEELVVGQEIAEEYVIKLCFSAAYIWVILHDAFHFEEEEQRTIYSNSVPRPDGQGELEVNWVLGALLLQVLGAGSVSSVDEIRSAVSSSTAQFADVWGSGTHLTGSWMGPAMLVLASVLAVAVFFWYTHKQHTQADIELGNSSPKADKVMQVVQIAGA